MEDRERLRHLLEHWLEHNEGHLKTYREWAERAGAMGVEGLQAALQEVVEETIKTSGLLKRAKGLLAGR